MKRCLLVFAVILIAGRAYAGSGLSEEECDAPFSSSNFTLKSCWEGKLKGLGETSVYTGSQGYAGDPQQGIIIVMPETDYPAQVEYWAVPTPMRAGAVSIVTATKNGLLTLKSEDGSYVFTFDVNTKAFLSASKR